MLLVLFLIGPYVDRDELYFAYKDHQAHAFILCNGWPMVAEWLANGWPTYGWPMAGYLGKCLVLALPYSGMSAFCSCCVVQALPYAGTFMTYYIIPFSTAFD